MSKLVEAGFEEENITTDILDIEPPADCKYYQFKQMVAPKILKK